MAKQKAAKAAKPAAPAFRMPQIDFRDPLTIYMFAMIAARLRQICLNIILS